MAQHTASTTLRNSTAAPSPVRLTPAMMQSDEIATQRLQPRERTILVDTRQPAVSDDIRHQDCRELSGVARCASRSGRNGEACGRRLETR
jgi:hypothetical protein